MDVDTQLTSERRPEQNTTIRFTKHFQYIWYDHHLIVISSTLYRAIYSLNSLHPLLFEMFLETAHWHPSYIRSIITSTSDLSDQLSRIGERERTSLEKHEYVMTTTE